MPLVFTQNESSLEERKYGDVLGKVYEYPRTYRSIIQPGERFVYYRGRRRADGGTQTPSYFGCGRVGDVTEAGKRLRCTIIDYEAFDEPVPFKDGTEYREPEANHRTAVGFYFQNGVRQLDRSSYDKILAAGLRSKTATAATKKRANGSRRPATSEQSDKTLAIALALATSEAKIQWPAATIFRAPAGQHFSLIVRHPSGENHHICVRSTAASEPFIRLSRGDITYAATHATAYSLWVFYSVDLTASTALLIKRKGRITDDDIDLDAAEHGARLKNVRAGKRVGMRSDGAQNS